MKNKMRNRQPIAVLYGTVLLALVVLPVGMAHADSAAAFTNFTLSAISPVCFGSTPSVTITAGVANPSSDSCEIVITNQIWSWSASGGGSCSPTNGNGDTSWTWTNASAGNNSITVAANVTFQGTNCNGGFTTNISGSTNFTITVIEITNQCVATTPTNQARTTIGVGEQVQLWLVGSPSGTFTWSTSAGSLSISNGTSTTLTAPDRAATATVTVSYGGGGSCEIAFDIKEPTGVNLLTNALQHTSGRPDVGFYAIVGLVPDTVNFGAVQCQEEDCNFIADGVYSYWDGKSHEGTNGPTILPFASTVYPGFGTVGYFPDHVYTGNPTNSPPFSSGTETCAIPWDFRVGSTGAWKSDFTTLIHNCSLSGGVNLMASKATAHWSCLLSDPTKP